MGERGAGDEVRVRVLAVTNMFPSSTRPTNGVFVEQQVDGLRRAGLEVKVLLVDRKNEGMGVYLRMRRPLQDAIARFQPSVVHVMYGGVMADRATRTVRDVSTVVTYHGSDLLGQNLSGLFRWCSSRWGVWCSKRAAQRASAVVVVSRQLREQLSKTVSRARIHVIPCGIDLQRFRPMDRNQCRRELGWSLNGFHILFPANNGDAVKRPLLARAATECLRGQVPEAELHFLQKVPNGDVPKWMNASDVLLLTSLHEGSPMVVKEAMACNLPVVSVNVGDVAERLSGAEGCHIAESNPRHLAAKLLSVRYASTRANLRWRVQDLSIEVIAKRLLNVYESVIRRGTNDSDGENP
jgi:teichuronic acid biosynthesis glycosyltransferase TuaC